MKKHTIKSAFKKCSMWPLSRKAYFKLVKTYNSRQATQSTKTKPTKSPLLTFSDERTTPEPELLRLPYTPKTGYEVALIADEVNNKI